MEDPHFLTSKHTTGDFPCGPVVRTLPSDAAGGGSVPGWDAKIPHTSQPKTKAEDRSDTVTNSIKT